jgi:hypothetical protein
VKSAMGLDLTIREEDKGQRMNSHEQLRNGHWWLLGRYGSTELVAAVNMI